jgi:hypothetical protein
MVKHLIGTYGLTTLFFFSPVLSFVSHMVPVLCENTEMVPPSIFSSKTNVWPDHPQGQFWEWPNHPRPNEGSRATPKPNGSGFGHPHFGLS